MLSTRPSLLTNRPLARASRCGSLSSRGIKLAKASTNAASAMAASASSGSTSNGWGCPSHSNCTARTIVQVAPMPLAISISRRGGQWLSCLPSNGSTSTLAS